MFCRYIFGEVRYATLGIRVFGIKSTYHFIYPN